MSSIGVDNAVAMTIFAYSYSNEKLKKVAIELPDLTRVKFQNKMTLPT